MPHRILCLLILCVSFSAIFAQGGVPEEYLEELEDYASASRNKQAEEAFTNFYGLFLSGAFTEPEQTIIAATTLKMQERKVRPQGGFVDYYHALEQIKNAENGEQRFVEWHKVISSLLDEPKFSQGRLEKFLKQSDVFLHTQILDVQPGGNDWIVAGGTTNWVYDGAPKLIIDDIDRLLLRSRTDSLEILETALVIDVAEGIAYGKGGKVDWQRVGLDSEVSADLLEYEFGTHKSGYTATKAKMRYPDYFGSREMLGSFKDQTSASGEKAGGSYPQFTSQDGYVEIKNVGEGIEMAGNFEIRGSTVYAIGDQGRKAAVEMTIAEDNGAQKVKARAERFSIRPQEKLGGESVETIIYFGEDSLYHPSVSMKVDIPGRVVQLVRTKSGSDRNPFYHSLNRVNIFADYLDIYLDQDSILIGKPTISFADKGVVRVESEDFFSKRDYYRIQNIADVNPLALILSLREQEVGSDFIDAERIAKRINPRFSVDNIQSLLYELAADGFITYDADEQRVRLKPKVSHYVRSDRNEKDYDRIRVTSDTREVNGSINLRTGEISLEGVKPLEFNGDKRLAIQPAGDRLKISGDRDFDFNGKVYAGFAVMEGNDFHFKYQPYHIVLDSVHYLDFFIPDPESDPEKPAAYSLASRIENISGILLLDAPRNKSGKQDIDIFPALKSQSQSFIFYDRGDTTSAYTRDSFYFEVDPFNFNHLHEVEKSDVSFKGKLHSGGIFEEIEEAAVIQEDLSLGFVSNTPEEGQTIYGSRGSYSGEISLSNGGLSGKGTLGYIGAEIESEDLRFELDRTTASANEFNVEEERGDRQLPQVRGRQVNIDWQPYSDSMLVNSTEEEPFDLYQSGDHTFDGLLVLTPEGLKGSGKLDWSAASMNSKAVDFGAFSADADTADVSIQSLESDNRLALSTVNVKANVDFEKQVGTFESNTEDLSTALPYNQFETSIKKFDWDMAGNTISFRAEDGSLGAFSSTHPDQDSLNFLGTQAIYDLNTSMLDVEGVDSVKSADALIFPADGKIRVEPGAKITELTDARIVADTVNRYHVINRATVRIKGRRRYDASGFYEYNVGPHEQELELQNIVGQPVGKGKFSEKATATRAEGTVMEGTTFYIDNNTRFRGTINLDATSKNLFFDGYAKMEAEYLHRPKWFTVASEGDKKDLTLEISKPKDFDGMPLHTGFFLSKERRLVYPMMIQTKDFRMDHPVLPITGVFKYDENNNRFLFGDSTRVVEGKNIGNLMILDDATGKLSGEGMLGIGGRLTYVDVKSYGKINMDVPAPPTDPIPEDEIEEEAAPEPDNDIMILEEEEETEEEGKLTIEAELPPEYPTVNVEMMSAIDLVLPDKLMALMATDIKSSSFASQALNLVSDAQFYRDGVENLFPASKEREAALQGMALGYIDLDKKINPHSLLFSRLQLRWNQDYQSFVSTERTTGLISINGESINKMVEVHVEFKMPSAGDDRFYVYVKSPSDLYYFFGFKDGIMNVTSNNTSFMDALETMKAKDLIIKMEDGETYEILPVELSTASTFLRRVRAAF